MFGIIQTEIALGDPTWATGVIFDALLICWQASTRRRSLVLWASQWQLTPPTSGPQWRVEGEGSVSWRQHGRARACPGFRSESGKCQRHLGNQSGWNLFLLDYVTSKWKCCFCFLLMMNNCGCLCSVEQSSFRSQ